MKQKKCGQSLFSLFLLSYPLPFLPIQLIAYGKNRKEATEKMKFALRNTVIIYLFKYIFSFSLSFFLFSFFIFTHHSLPSSLDRRWLDNKHSFPSSTHQPQVIPLFLPPSQNLPPSPLPTNPSSPYPSLHRQFEEGSYHTKFIEEVLFPSSSPSPPPSSVPSLSVSPSGEERCLLGVVGMLWLWFVTIIIILIILIINENKSFFFIPLFIDFFFRHGQREKMRMLKNVRSGFRNNPYKKQVLFFLSFFFKLFFVLLICPSLFSFSPKNFLFRRKREIL